ncbi:MAG: TonB family protein [Rhodanobacteraceae bacterium]|nr:MAG: TonB family protein [Rhodanobacteraceae bacterium]
MTELLLRMLCGVTLGLALVLLLRRPARRVFGAGPAFALWLLPVVLALAPWLPHGWMPAASWTLPAVLVTAQPAGIHTATKVPIVDGTYWLMIVWLFGAAAALLRLAFHYVRLLRDARVAPGAWRQMLHDVAPDFDLHRVRVHAHGPALLWALPRPLLLLPVDFAERFDSAATRELVLRHELTHARRGDAWWSLAMEIASVLLWFHPLAWLSRSRFRLDQELACDAASLRALPRRQANYARALLDSVAAQPAPALIPWLAEPQLKERIAMITRVQPGTLLRRVGFLVIATLLGGSLVVAGGAMPVLAAAPHASFTPASVDVTFKNHHMPKYPVKAAQEGKQGTVILDVTVDAQGDVKKVAVDPKGTTAPAVLQNVAMGAAAQWKFHPGMKHGHPVGGVVKIPVSFSLSYPPSSASASCPSGLVYRQGKGKSFSCIAPASAQAST